ncbi:hypothetical protein M885DRAFT_552735 [Pelagophyceae sp. CCMP2097]|nr:hypothetical protein M885DRAFT_552735 [Pelagophyceae sp. CCMP2097]
MLAACGGGLMLLGGMADAPAAPCPTLLLDGAAGPWRALREGRGRRPCGAAPRANAALAPVGDGRALLFGGYTGAACLADAWVYEARAPQGPWRRLRPEARQRAAWPPARAGHGMVVAEAATAYLFGGWDGARVMFDDLWALDVAAATAEPAADEPGAATGAAAANAGGATSRFWWTKVEAAGRRPSCRSCFTMTTISGARGGYAAVAAVVGGLAPDWTARDAAPYLLHLPRCGGALPPLWTKPDVFGPTACRAIAFHAACAPPAAQGGGDYEAALIVFGGGSGRSERATNFDDLFVLRRVLWTPRTAQLFGPGFRHVVAACVASKRLSVDEWSCVFHFASARWFGDEPPPAERARLEVGDFHEHALDADERHALDADEDSGGDVWTTDDDDENDDDAPGDDQGGSDEASET